MKAGFDHIAGTPIVWTAGVCREPDLCAVVGSIRSSIKRSSIGTELARASVAPPER